MLDRLDDVQPVQCVGMVACSGRVIRPVQALPDGRKVLGVPVIVDRLVLWKHESLGVHIQRANPDQRNPKSTRVLGRG